MRIGEVASAGLDELALRMIHVSLLPRSNALNFFFSSRTRHTIWTGDWSSDVCSSDLYRGQQTALLVGVRRADKDHGRAISKIGKRFLYRKEHPFEQDVRQLVEQLLRHAFNRRELSNAGICHENIDLSKTLAGLREQVLDVTEFSHVALDRKHLAAQTARRQIERSAVATEDDDLRTVGLKFLRGRQSNSAIAPCNHRNLIFELHFALPHASVVILFIAIHPALARKARTQSVPLRSPATIATNPA